MTRESGICWVCGCSEFVPCPAGCAWTNSDKNFCTSCAELQGDQLAALAAVKMLHELQWRCTTEKVAAAVGFSPERAQAELQELEAAGLVVFDSGYMTHAQHTAMLVDSK